MCWCVICAEHQQRSGFSDGRTLFSPSDRKEYLYVISIDINWEVILIAQSVSCCLLTRLIQARFLTSPCEIFSGKMAF